jgi:hypothetical protein
MMLTRPDSSAAYALEVARLLWPEPWDEPQVTRSARTRGAAHKDAYVFPSRTRPRLLIPTDVPAAASMLRRLGNDRSPIAGPTRRLLERTVRTRAFALARWPILRVPAANGGGRDSIEAYLASWFGSEVRVGVILGTRRANQKPVLQAFDRDGNLLGYVKVGHNDVTSALVRREAESLTAIGTHELRSFRVPQVLHHGRWTDLEILVLSPLESDPRVPVPDLVRRAAMRELAFLAGTTSGPLGDSPFWARLRRSVELLARHPEGRRVQVIADGLEKEHGSASVRFGGWHGDWGHWNMAMSDGVLQVWDWERYDPAVPIGFDGLHFAAQKVRPGRPDSERAKEQSFLGSVPDALAEFDVDPRDQPLTLHLYLLEMAVRYVDASTHGATPALRRRISWVLSLLERPFEHEHPVLSEGRS